MLQLFTFTRLAGLQIIYQKSLLMKPTHFRIRNGLNTNQKPKGKLAQIFHADSEISDNHQDFSPHPRIYDTPFSKNPEFLHLFKNILSSLEQLGKSLTPKRSDFEVRDRSYLLDIPSGTSFLQRKETLKKWIEKMINDVVSIAFNYYSNDELTYEQAKVYCSQNILSNIAALVAKYHLTSQELREIDEFIRDDVLDLLLKKYPMTESIVVNRALEAVAKAPDLSQKLQNDFFSTCDIQFPVKADYSREIKLVINSIICRINDDSSLLPGKTNFQIFKKYMSKIFEMVEDKDWMQASQNQRNSAFDSAFRQANEAGSEVKPREAVGMDNDIQKREYREKVRHYTSYLIGRKVNENIFPFSDAEIDAKGVQIKNTAILRTLTKWCEQLWQKFIPKNYYVNKFEDFRLLTGEVKSLSQEMRSHLDKLMQAEKAQIRSFMAKLTNDNYQAQVSLLNQLLEDYEDEFRERDLERVSEKFSVLIGKSLEKWVVKYLNRLLEGLTKVGQQFHANYSSKDWPSPPNLITFRIGDLLRCKCSSGQRQILYIFKQIKWLSETRQDVLAITRIKNRLSSGTNDILMNVKFSGTVICEIQLAVKSNKSKFLASSNGMSHYLYQIQRSLFGPLNELGSIWRNLDLRAGYFDKSSGNVRNAGSHRCQALRKAFEFQIFDGPFICSICSNTYSQNSLLLKHVKCSQCSFWKCTYCRIQETSAEKLAQMFIADLQLRNMCQKKVQIDEEHKQLPNYGVAVHLNAEQDPQIIVFKKLQVRGIHYLFAKDGGQIKMILRLAEEGVQKRFLKQYLAFEMSTENGSNLISISVGQVTEEYFLPKHVAECYHSLSTAITLQNQPLNSSNCRAILQQESRQNQEAITILTLVNTAIDCISPLQEIFPNLIELTLNKNSQLLNFQNLPAFGNLQTLTIRDLNTPEIPKQIASLPTLIKLDLQDCIFSLVPPQIGSLKQLRYLDLSHSQNKPWKRFIRSLPNELYTLSQLQELNLSCQQIYELSKDLANLKNLRSLNLRRNSISNLPESINQLKKLTFLDFRENPINSLPKSLAFARNLKQFRLQLIGENILNLFNEPTHRNIFSQLPADLQEVQNLTVIDVHSENLKELPSLEKCQHLQEVNLFRCSLIAFPRFKDCYSLKRLSFKQQMNKQAKTATSIPPAYFKETPNLLYFCASFNSLRFIPPSIKHLTQLVELDLHYNQIEQVCEEIGCCTSLVKINLQTNKIRTLPNSLRNLQKLQYLALSVNALIDLNESVSDCIGLHQLLLSENMIQSLPQNLGKLINLQVLNLESNLIQILPKSLNNLKKLQPNTLKLFNNPLFLIQSGDIIDQAGDFRSKPLKNYLDKGSYEPSLNEDRLETIRPEIARAVNLTKICIKHQLLKQLPLEFSKLAHLQSLTLNENKFVDFPIPVTGCTALKCLQFEDCLIKSLPSEIGRLVNLQLLNMMGNHLENVPEDISGCISLKKIYFSRNKFGSLQSSAFSKLESLQLISLTENQLIKFPEVLLQCKNLEELYLGVNKITSLPCRFKSGTNLKRISLCNNSLTIFPEELLDCDSLEMLNLDNNQIVNLSQHIHRLTNLRVLEMNDNKLTELPRTIGLVKSLRELYLANNQIKVVIKELSQLVDFQIGRLNLYRNPIETVECKEWLLQHGTDETKKFAHKFGK